MSNLSPELTADINEIGSISVIPNILDVICLTTGMGFAAVARVTTGQWIACAVHDDINFGLKPGGELVLETTICHEIRQSGEPVVIDHVEEDIHFRDHHTPAMYGFQSYISIPIYRKNGAFFGTLCAIDPKPARLNNPQIIGMFNLYADLISFHLDAIEQLESTNSQLAKERSQLAEERKTAELREQFIAILGHDLRNPLGAITNSAQLMLKMAGDDKLKRLANIVKDSAYRMTGLIENVLDFARGRLGEGIILERRLDEQIEDVLTEVITELRAAWPDSTITFEADLQEPVHGDGKRIAQLFSNLLGNALTHGNKNEPVRVRAESSNGIFLLSVTNHGEKIPETTQKQLFQPFSRGKIQAGQQGLGLGLYIASQIAQAHNGSLQVSSDEEKTCFTFRFKHQDDFR